MAGDGHWVTMNGTHVLIGGDARGGVKQDRTPSNVTKHPAGSSLQIMTGAGGWRTAKPGTIERATAFAKRATRSLTVAERRQAITGNIGPHNSPSREQRRQAITGNVAANVRQMQDRIGRAPSSRFNSGGRTGRFSTGRYG